MNNVCELIKGKISFKHMSSSPSIVVVYVQCIGIGQFSHKNVLSKKNPCFNIKRINIAKNLLSVHNYEPVVGNFYHKSYLNNIENISI